MAIAANRKAGQMGSPWEVLGRAGSDLLPLVDLLQDFLRELGSTSGATSSAVASSFLEAEIEFGSFACSSSNEGMLEDDVRGDFGGGSGLGFRSIGLLVP